MDSYPGVWTRWPQKTMSAVMSALYETLNKSLRYGVAANTCWLVEDVLVTTFWTVKGSSDWLCMRV